MRSITDPAREQMLEKLLLPEVRELIQVGDSGALGELLNHWQAVEIALLVNDLEPVEQVTLTRALQPALRAETFEYLDVAAQQRLLDTLGGSEAADLLNRMAPDDRTALLEALPTDMAARLLRLLTPEEREVAESLLEYGHETVGRLMTPDFVAVKAEWTMQQVLEHVRKHGRDSETLNHVYVTDEQGKLIDDIRIREVLLAPLNKRVGEIMNRQFASLSATDNQRDAVEVFRRYDRSALPVIDANGVLVGIVTND